MASLLAARLSAVSSAVPSLLNTLESGLIVDCFVVRGHLLLRPWGGSDVVILIIIAAIFINRLNFHDIVRWIAESISREAKQREGAMFLVCIMHDGIIACSAWCSRRLAPCPAQAGNG
jgi:hypothetical protein